MPGRHSIGRKGNSVAEEKPDAPKQGVAHVPATMLTVEYVDDGKAMDAALKNTATSLQKTQDQINALREKQNELISVLNRQAREMGKHITAIARRIDAIYQALMETDLEPERQEEPAEADDALPAEAAPAQEASAGEPPLALIEDGLPEDVADDPDHQNAWRVARVLAADIEAYHEDQVREGVLYGTFYQLLDEPIEKARKTYEQRVPKEIVENYDYFSKALDELIARKRMAS